MDKQMDVRQDMYMNVCVGDTVWAAEGRDGGVVDAVVYIWGSTSAQFPTCMQGPASSKQITCKLSVSCSFSPSASLTIRWEKRSITVFCVPNLIGQRCLFIALFTWIIFFGHFWPVVSPSSISFGWSCCRKKVQKERAEDFSFSALGDILMRESHRW